MTNERNEVLSKEILESFKTIVDDAGRAVTKLPEATFIKVFLPVLAHRFINQHDESFDIHKWISVAGGPFRPVDVIDSNGEVLYTVPPVYESSGVHSMASRHSVFEIVSTLMLEIEQNPINANRKVRDRLFNSLAVQGSNQTRFLVMWAFILKRYGYPVPWADGIEEFSEAIKEPDVKPDTSFDADSFEEV